MLAFFMSSRALKSVPTVVRFLPPVFHQTWPATLSKHSSDGVLPASIPSIFCDDMMVSFAADSSTFGSVAFDLSTPIARNGDYFDERKEDIQDR